MDVYVVQRSRTADGRPIGVYRDIERARQEADFDAAGAFGENTRTISEPIQDGIEMRVHLVDGNRVGSHAIFQFTLDEEVDHPDLSEPQIKPSRRLTFEDV